MNRTKTPPKRKIIQSPKKGKTGAKSQRTPTPPDSPFENEDYETETQRQETLDNSEDPDYDPQEDINVQEIGHQRNQEEVKGQQRSPKNMATATVPKQSTTRKSRRQAPRKKNSLELQIISQRPQHKRSRKYRRWTHKQRALHILPTKGTTRSHRHNLNQHNLWTIPCRSSRLRKREK